jgi:hypothetical protein
MRSAGCTCVGVSGGVDKHGAAVVHKHGAASDRIGHDRPPHVTHEIPNNVRLTGISFVGVPSGGE